MNWSTTTHVTSIVSSCQIDKIIKFVLEITADNMAKIIVERSVIASNIQTKQNQH